MNKESIGNVLVIGNSGVGKSTLINAVLGEDVATTGWGTQGTTKELRVYESKNDNISFRVIDTVGFEPGYLNERRALKSVGGYLKTTATDGDDTNLINVIWFCVDGCARKLFDKTIQNLAQVTKIYKSVPIIAVITKSYSVPERAENIQMVSNAFAKQKGAANLRKIIPVVAQTYELNESAFAPTEGIDALIKLTNELLPEGKQLSKDDIDSYVLGRKRVWAHGAVLTATAAGAAAGAIPLAYPDAALLAPIETVEVKMLAKIFEIESSETSRQFFDKLIEIGTVGTLAKEAIIALKAIPGVNLAASVLNAIVAGVIVATLGEVAIFAFEKIYRGKEDIANVDWLQSFVDKNFVNNLAEKIDDIITNIPADADSKTIATAVTGAFVNAK